MPSKAKTTPCTRLTWDENKRQSMNNASSPKTSETDWARIDAMTDEDIDFSKIPAITAAQIARATLRFGGVEIEPGKRPLQVLLDDSIIDYIDYFVAQSDDRDYHQLINTALSPNIFINIHFSANPPEITLFRSR
jgi:hypothetical protein